MEIENAPRKHPASHEPTASARRSRGESSTSVLRQGSAVRNLAQALREGQLFMVYQPVVNPRLRSAVGVEALLRWRHPDLGVLAPGFFIDALSDEQLASQVGYFVMNEAVRQAAQWREQGVRVGRVAFNVMEADFQMPGFTTRLSTSMSRWGALPEDLCVEVTEGMFLGSDSASIIEEIRSLARFGVEVAFDDFGTGFASLSHLRLPTSRIKIDRSFVSNLTANLIDREIVAAVVSMGKAIGKAVTAEGIETPEQRDTLLALGCDTHQGFLYSKGIAAEEIPGFVSRFEAREG